jgi:hypothetical protein
MPRRSAGRPRGSSPPQIGIIAIGAAVAAAILLRPEDGTGGGDGNVPDGSGSGELSSEAAEVTVPVNHPWTNTGVQCAAGDTFNIKSSGQAWFDAGEELQVGPDGLGVGEFESERVYVDATTASLIGVLDTSSYHVPVG